LNKYTLGSSFRSGGPASGAGPLGSPAFDGLDEPQRQEPAAPAQPKARPAAPQAASVDPLFERRARPRPQSLGAQPELAWLPGGLPQKNRRLPILSLAWLCASVVIPLLLAIVYYGLLASQQFQTEFHFVVRQPLSEASVLQNASISNDAVTENMSAIVGKNATTGEGAADSLDNYMVADYITSPQAARDLDQRLKLRGMYSRSDIDPVARFSPKGSTEKLEAYWRKMAHATYDPATGLGVVTVRAFSAADAYAIATALVDLSNGIVNSAGKRSRADSVRFAELQLDQSLSRLTEVRGRLAALRRDHGVIDPSKSAVPENVSLSDKLRNDLTEQETRLTYLSSQLADPQAPQIQTAKAQIAADQAKLRAVDAEVGRSPSAAALTSVVGDFEQLDDERQSAEQAYLAAIAKHQQALSAEGAQRVYVATYVSPSLPTSSTYPKRLSSIGLVLLGSAMVWVVGLMVAKSVMEHGR
jgi:capsular polysaccharide transport system permease protein